MADEFHESLSVVIVNYERAETTIKCVESVGQSRGDYVREIIVVDNGSSPAVIAELSEALAGKARLVSLGVNRHFGEGNNIGVEEATGELVLLLNNDAYVDPECIPELVGTMRANPAVAAVGPMLLYPDGSVQEVGAIVLENGDICQVGKGAYWGADHYTSECTVDYCSAACLLMRRRHFIDVGGFSLQWEPAYYEDVDLCLNLHQEVGPVVVNPRARAVHIQSMTTSDPSLQLGSEINRLVFVAKWGAWLRARQAFRGGIPQTGKAAPGRSPEPSPTTDDAHPKYSCRRSRINSAVLFSPYEFVPGGGERYLFELAAAIAEILGRDSVRMSTRHRHSDLRIRQMNATFGLEGPTTSITLDQLRDQPPDLAIVLGNEIAPPIPGYGRLHNIYVCQFPFSAPEEYIRANAPFLEAFDEIWVYSEFARRYVSGYLKLLGLRSRKTRVMPPPATLHRPINVPEWRGRSALMTVGRFFQGGHNKRQDIVIEIVKRLNEVLGRSVPLVMAGSLQAMHTSRLRFHELQRMTDGIECHLYPNVQRERLIELYTNSAVLVHAAGYGVDKFAFPERLEHFGIVPVEAASVGCIPVVYGEGGPAEVMTALECPTAFHSVPEAVETIARLFAEPEESGALSRALMERSGLFSQSAFRERAREALVGVL